MTEDRGLMTDDGKVEIGGLRATRWDGWMNSFGIWDEMFKWGCLKNGRDNN